MYAVITGAASGIGREIARQIAQRGLALVVTDRDEDRLATLVDELERACGNRSPILDATPLDISDHDAVHDWAEQIIASHGAPAHVYHAAGIAIWGDVRRMPEEKWQKVIDVNLLGTVNMVRAWTPAMANAGALAPGRRGKKRTFMAISSAAAIIGLPWHAAYSASKAGVLGMCEVLRFDLAPHGVSVHVAVPGAVDTPLVRTVDIDGVDRSQPRVARLTKLFQRHAITPEKAAQKIIRGVDRDKFLIPTSADVPLARVAKVLAPWAYRGVMRGLNRGFRWAAAKQHR